jgi:hypothetical protein
MAGALGMADMRIFFLLPVAAALLGCGPGLDPNLEKPCGERGTASLVVGPGEDDFEAISSSGVDIQSGPQGGYHIWIGLSTRALGPNVIAHYGVRDVETGEDLTGGGLRQVIELEYDEDSGTNRAAGIYGYLLDPLETDEGGGGGSPSTGDLTGHHVVLWAEVTDQCHTEPVRGETETVVRGYN